MNRLLLSGQTLSLPLVGAPGVLPIARSTVASTSVRDTEALGRQRMASAAVCRAIVRDPASPGFESDLAYPFSSPRPQPRPEEGDDRLDVFERRAVVVRMTALVAQLGPSQISIAVNTVVFNLLVLTACASRIRSLLRGDTVAKLERPRT